MLTKSMACLAKATNIAKLAVRAFEDTNDALSRFLVSLSGVALRLLVKHLRVVCGCLIIERSCPPLVVVCECLSGVALRLWLFVNA